MLKVTGLDKFQKELAEAQRAMSDMDGDLGSVQFDPHDPASIERAIQEVGRLVDDRVGLYANNAIVAPLAAEMKEKYRAAIIDKAAEARSKPEND